MPQQKYDPLKPKRQPVYPNHYLGDRGSFKELINKDDGNVKTGIGALDNYNRNAKIDELGPQAQYMVNQTAEYYKKNPAARKAQLQHTARAAKKNSMSALLKVKK